MGRTEQYFRIVGNEFTCTIECDKPCGFPLKVLSDGGIQLCSRTSCRARPFCWQHAKRVFGVRVVDTRSIRGHGLRAERDFKKGDFIVFYGGERINRTKFNRRYTKSDGTKVTGPYATQAENLERSGASTYYVDAACDRGYGSIANDAMGPRASRRESKEARLARAEYLNAEIQQIEMSGDPETRGRMRNEVTGVIDARLEEGGMVNEDMRQIVLDRMPTDANVLALFATKDIAKGDPIRVDYGFSYWDYPQAEYRVRRRKSRGATRGREREIPLAGERSPRRRRPVRRSRYRSRVEKR